MYPDIVLYNYVKDRCLSKNVIYLIEEMDNWKHIIEKDAISLRIKVVNCKWTNIDKLVVKRDDAIALAFVTMQKKYDYVKILYEKNLPFFIFAPTSILGLTKCGELFREKGVNLEIIPHIIHCIDETENNQRKKPPFNLSIFSSHHFGDNALTFWTKS